MVRIKVNRNEDGTIEVAPIELLSRETVPDIRKRLFRLARKSGVGDMLVDLSGVSALDTAGLAMLVELHIFLSNRGRKLRLEGGNEQVDRMIHLASLDQFFQTQGLSNGGA